VHLPKTPLGLFCQKPDENPLKIDEETGKN
jgi:hypothetical protein